MEHNNTLDILLNCYHCKCGTHIYTTLFTHDGPMPPYIFAGDVTSQSLSPASLQILAKHVGARTSPTIISPTRDSAVNMIFTLIMSGLTIQRYQLWSLYPILGLAHLVSQPH